jgi:aspartate kinase
MDDYKLALADIPLRMISYGSNDSDVAFVIKTEDKKRALQALSNRLFEPETDKIVK